MNIILIGTIAAEKSTIGRAISEMSQFKFVDTDDLAQERIELTKSSFFNFARQFYDAERQVIEELEGRDASRICAKNFTNSKDSFLSTKKREGDKQ